MSRVTMSKVTKMNLSINMPLKWLKGGLLALALPLGVISSANATDNRENTAVSMTLQGIGLEYDQSVRLDRVLSDALNQLYFDQESVVQEYAAQTASSYSPYPEGYKLFNLDKQSQADELFNNVVQQLEVLRLDMDYQQNAAMLLQQLKQLSFAYREDINLDLDAIRLEPSLNPSLPGSYALELNSRPDTVLFFGLVEQTQQPFSASKQLGDYIQQTALLAQSNNSDAWVISPDGRTQKVGFAYWNNQHMNLMPGSTVFIGFNSSGLSVFDNDLEKLEQDIVTLLGFITNSFIQNSFIQNTPMQYEVKG
ncbi:capsule biosynthesis GfcC family protein [Vibrio cortegadensis]|uniref:Capsule biosynthesis GfcC family protein n=1 Tax=Vibrio cortegadensis TaxID=1328770 RepID=A0ABV4M703_9VIBR